ncbi:hypothetical protein ACFBZI_07520 [Moraxella sp. ZJ142]|uniref:hypothetical protein n=1 Tax=Moraxella marmotae TaxID=3344520 RepID=UPI0035D4DD92
MTDLANKPSQSAVNNHAKVLIDQLLWRMSSLDRFSDDETVICGGELMPLDVVKYIDEGEQVWYGIVQKIVRDEPTGTVFAMAMCRNACGMIRAEYDMDWAAIMPMRTIDELEAVTARQYLMHIYTGGKA